MCCNQFSEAGSSHPIKQNHPGSEEYLWQRMVGLFSISKTTKPPVKKLKAYLRAKGTGRPGKGAKGIPSEWFPVCKLKLAGPKLLVIDPSFAPAATDGLLVRAAPGNYAVSAKCLYFNGDRRIARLRLLLEGATKAVVGARVGKTWSDTGAIGVIDHKVFSEAWGDDDDASYERIRETIEDVEFCDVAILSRAKGAIMPFVESGFGDGTFPVYELLEKRRRVGIEVEFIADAKSYPFEYASEEEIEEKPVPFVERLRAAALQGDGARANELALHHLDGDGVPESPARARGWFRYALKLGYAKAGDNLGIMMRDGVGGIRNVARARRYFELAAEMGQPDAMTSLGCLYRDGIGVTADLIRATQLFEKAAQAGSAFAQFNLGVHYANGQGVAKDPVAAFRWYRESATNGFVKAQCNLGYCYLHGIGIDKDPAAAVVWFRLAAAEGNVIATINLGHCFQTGSGVPKNPKEALRLYKSVRDQHPMALNNLGDCYEKGCGLKRSAPKAFQLYTQAAEKGLALAQFNLGCLYEKGSGTRKNLSEARSWYEMAANQGNEEAQAALARLDNTTPRD